MFFNSLKKNIHYFFSFISLIITLTVMGAWFVQNPNVIQISRGESPFMFNGAFALFLLSLTILLYRHVHYRWLRVLSLSATLIGLLTLAEYLFNINLGIDTLAVQPFFVYPGRAPGRMAMSMAFCLVMMGSVWSVKKSRFNNRLVCVAFSSLTIAFCLSSVASHLAGFNSEYAWGVYSNMALHGALCFILIGCATLALVRAEVRAEENRHRALLPYGGVVVGVLLTALIWQLLVSRDLERSRRLANIQLNTLDEQIERAFAPIDNGFAHMGIRMYENVYTHSRQWAIDVESYLLEFEGLRQMVILHPDRTLKWVSPETGELPGLLPSVISSLPESLKDDFYISPTLKVSSGELAFVAFVPVMQGKELKGIVAGLFLVEPFFRKVLKASGFDIEISEQGQRIFSNSVSHRPIGGESSYLGNYHKHGVYWQVRIVPTADTIYETASAVPGIVLVFGVSVNILLGAILLLYNRSRDSENQALMAYEWKNAAMNSIPWMVISLDKEGSIREMNFTAEKTLELSTEEVLWNQKKIYDVGEVRLYQKKMEHELGREIESVTDFLESFVKLGLGRASEWTLNSRRGKKIPVIVTVSEILDYKKETTGYLLVLEDITALKDKELQLKEQEVKIRAASRLASLGEMAAGIAHEINNPLAIINGQLGLLKRSLKQKGLEEEGEISERVRAIEIVVERIARIIRGLRSYVSKDSVEEGDIISLREIIHETLSYCEQRCRSEGVDLKINIKDECYIKAQSHRISQVLVNLLNNAVDAVSESRHKQILVEVQRAKNGVQISVADSGPGISYELRSRIMQPFFTTKEVGKGMGLGLSISQGILQSYGGKLELDESSTKTKFIIWLPEQEKL